MKMREKLFGSGSTSRRARVRQRAIRFVILAWASIAIGLIPVTGISSLTVSGSWNIAFSRGLIVVISEAGSVSLTVSCAALLIMRYWPSASRLVGLVFLALVIAVITSLVSAMAPIIQPNSGGGAIVLLLLLVPVLLSSFLAGWWASLMASLLCGVVSVGVGPLDTAHVAAACAASAAVSIVGTWAMEKWLASRIGEFERPLRVPTLKDDVKMMLNLPAADADEVRRHALFVMVICLFAVVTIIAFLGWEVCYIVDPDKYGPAFWILDFFGLAAITLIASRRHPRLVRWIGLVALTVGLVYVDDPAEIVDGRASLVFFFPILMSAFVLPTYAAFVVGAISILCVVAVGINTGLEVNVIMLGIIMASSAFSWMAGWSVERAARGAQAEAAKNRAVLDSIGDAVIVFDQEWTVMTVNPAAQSILGESLTGLKLSTLLQRGGISTEQRFWEAVSDLEKNRLAYTMLEWGGRVLSVSLSPVQDGERKSIGRVAVLRDVTKEVELRRAKDALLGTSAHELRTPLNAIVNWLSMLLNGMVERDQYPRVLRRLLLNTNRLQLLVNNLLDHARLQAGEVEVAMRPLRVSQLVEDVTELMAGLAQEKGLALGMQVSESVPEEIMGAEDLLHQVLVNLVGNAIKFTDEGTIEVAVMMPDKGHWSMTVSDTGQGIPDKDQERVFDRFAVGENYVTRKHQGAGLGLSIVRELVELMGGSITLKSQAGVGSAFTVTLPMQ